MAWNGIPVIDGDGHVMEDWDSLLQYMPEPYIKSGRFRGRIFHRSTICTRLVFSNWCRALSDKLASRAGSSSWTRWGSGGPCFTQPEA